MEKPLPVIPLNAPALRATHARVLFDGGSHVLSLMEMRQLPLAAIGDNPQSAMYEIGRFSLSPQSIRWLIEHLQIGVIAYEKAVGAPNPDEAILRTRLGSQAAIESLQNELRQPETGAEG